MNNSAGMARFALKSSYTFADPAVYSIDAVVGGQSVTLALDTGSGDTWIASTQCSTVSCSGNIKRYDPALASNSTGKDWSIDYLAGSVSGVIVLDSLALIDGSQSLTIQSQALAAANQVNAEPLSGSGFSGLLGLAPPGTSIIRQELGAGSGKTVLENLPSNFFTLVLGRAGDTRYDSVLTVGEVNNELPASIPVQSVTMVDALFNAQGVAYWKVQVSQIQVNNVALPLDTILGANTHTAILDSGVPTMLASSAFCNAFYGAAANVGPASDGMYYVPCETELNVTVSMLGQTIPIHPLDLSLSGMKSGSCIGTLQSFEVLQQIGTKTDVVQAADFILGAAFLRNVYSVYSFTGSSTQIGVLALTDAATAHQEFQNVRIKGLAFNGTTATMAGLSSGQSSATATTGTTGTTPGAGPPGPRHITAGQTAGIVLGVFSIFCLLLSVLLTCIARSRRRQRTKRGSKTIQQEPGLDMIEALPAHDTTLCTNELMSDIIQSHEEEQKMWERVTRPRGNSVVHSPDPSIAGALTVLRDA